MATMWSPFGWVSLLVAVLSLLLGCLMFYEMIFMCSWLRLKVDVHFRFYVLTSVVVVIHRFCGVGSYIAYKSILINKIDSRCESALCYFYRICNSVTMTTAWLMLWSTFMLMAERYKRLEMITKGSWRYKQMVLWTIVFSIDAFCIILAYLWNAIDSEIRRTLKHEFFISYQLNSKIMDIRLLNELVLLAGGIILYYYFNIKMIWTTLATMSQTSRSSLHISPTMVTFRSNTSTAENVYQTKKLKLRNVLLFYTACTLLSDVGAILTAVMNVIDNTVKRDYGDETQLLFHSWIIFHIWFQMKLLDHLKNGLIDSKRAKKEYQQQGERTDNVTELSTIPSFHASQMPTRLDPVTNDLFSQSGQIEDKPVGSTSKKESTSKPVIIKDTAIDSCSDIIQGTTHSMI